MAFLLIVPGKTVKGEMAFGLAMVWAHPAQAHLFSLDEATWKLTLLIDIGNNWAYTFVQLNEGTLCVPLSNEGHISTMIDGVPSWSACGHLHQLEVHKLLQCKDQVVCPKGLNGGLEPVLISLPELPVWDMNTLSEPVHETSLLQVDLFHAMLGDKCPSSQVPAEPPCHLPPPILPWSVPVKQLTTPVWLLSFKSSYLRWHWTPAAQSQRTLPWGDQHQHPWVTHQPSEWRTHLGWRGQFQPCPSWWLPPSRHHHKQLHLMMPSQSAIHPLWPGIGNSWGSQYPYHPTIWDSSRDRLGCPLCWSTPTTREMNRAMGWLPTTRASIDTHHRKKVLDPKTIFHQNEAQTAKAIKEVRAHCTTVIQDAEATCTAAIREAEATCADCACTPQQSHGECMQDIEREAIEEEGRDCQSFLTACGAALQTCAPEACGIFMYPLQLLMGNISLAALLAISPQLSTAMGESAPATPHPTVLVVPIPKWQHHSSGEEATGPATLAKEPTYLKWKEGKSLMGLKENHQEAFCWDTNLVQVTRETYFEAHHPTFDKEGSHNLYSLFWEMITSANLLESEIYEIQQVWTRWKDLRYAHHAMRSLPKGLSFFHLVSPSESPKVMGLKWIHHPNALCHHAGLSYCPWCGKKRQNKGALVNHLQTMCYKWGLVYSRCLFFPVITSKAMWHLGQAYKPSDAKEEDGRPINDNTSTSDWFTSSHPLHLQWCTWAPFICSWIPTIPNICLS